MARRNFASEINDQLAHEAQYVARTARIDLAWFMSLPAGERAQVWQGWDYSAKFQVCAQRLGDWTTDEVEAVIAYYDQKWSAAQPATSSDVAPAVAAQPYRAGPGDTQMATAVMSNELVTVFLCPLPNLVGSAGVWQ